MTGLVASSASGREQDQDFPPGEVISERYRILGIVGEGGMGKVYLAEHVEVGRKVALKVLRSEWSMRPSIMKRFRAEARTAGSIGHPNIVQVFDAGTLPDGRLFLVMEHLAGRDLADELYAVQVFDPRRACNIVRHVALALGAGHRAGIIHRDVKPSNVMLVSQPEGEVAKVLDFGIAANPGGAVRGERLTDPGALLGTPEYMAPEQATGDDPTPQFDVYACGVILYEMLSGDLPLSATHGFDLLSLKVHQPSPPLASRVQNLPLALTDLVDECLEIDPDTRPPDGDALAARLDAVLADMAPGTTQAVRATPQPAAAIPGTLGPLPAAPPPSRLPTLGIVIAGVAVLGTIALALGTRPAVPIEDTIDPLAVAPEPAQKIEPPRPTPPRPEPPRPELVVPPFPEIDPGGTTAAEAPGGSTGPSGLSEKTSGGPTPGKADATPRPKPPSDDHLSVRCERLRTTAEEARRAQRWAQLRDASRQRECWASAQEARKLHTKALMELGDFAGCLSSGKGLKDQEVQTWLKLCEKRAGG